MLRTIRHLARRQLRRRRRREPQPTIWYHPDYRVPIEGLGLETRRADLVAWSVLDLGIVDAAQIERPVRASYHDLAAVHSDKVLSALSDASVLAPIFGASARELPMETIANTIRLACGATLAAARRAAAGAGPQVNLLGGFHHASPNRAGGFSVVNDIAIAMHALRRQGFSGRIAVLDLDAHPPDGTADCVLEHASIMGEVWIGSISGSDWGIVPGVDETVIPGAEDEDYLHALDRLLGRMPPSKLCFVVAGGDILAGDRFGALQLTLEGACRRDRRVARRLRNTPSVWLSAGGYSDAATFALLNTVATLALTKPLKIPPHYDPVRARFSKVARELVPPVDDSQLLTEADLAEAFGFQPANELRLLGTYTPDWIEHALYRYGILDHIERLGYGRFRVVIDRAADGDRLRLFGRAQGGEHLLLETMLDKVKYGQESFLFVNWLTLRHPIAEFTEARPKLPNQEVPGLGLAKEAGELLALVAQRLGWSGVAIRPAAYHVAYTARHDFTFADAARQGRFEKLIEDLGDVPLGELTRAIATERVMLDGELYRWEPDLMVARLDGERTAARPCKGLFALTSKREGAVD